MGTRTLEGDDGAETVIPLVVAPNLDVGLLYVFAVSSIAVYAVILGGWASNNKFSFLGALRSSAQLIAYELPLGVAILAIVLVTGSLRLAARGVSEPRPVPGRGCREDEDGNQLRCEP